MCSSEKDSELEELRRYVAELKKEYSGLLDENEVLVNDNKACIKHLDTLVSENYQVNFFIFSVLLRNY